MTKILLLDDSKFLRLATERALARAEYAVNTASDGEQALPMARELKKDPSNEAVAVVVFTGLSQKKTARLQPDGAVAFLDKSDLALDKGSEALLTALAEIVRKLKIEEVPAGHMAGNEVRAGC